jgi:hypothetical protein
MNSSVVENLEQLAVRTDVVVGIYAAGLMAVLATTATLPRDGRHVLVAATPWSDPGSVERIVAAAGGRLAGGTRFSFLTVATSADGGFVDHLYRAGAVAVLDASAFIGCGDPQRE